MDDGVLAEWKDDSRKSPDRRAIDGQALATNPQTIREPGVPTISKMGQSALPKRWRYASGLSRGELVEVRPTRDGNNSILLTQQPVMRRDSRIGAFLDARGLPLVADFLHRYDGVSFVGLAFAVHLKDDLIIRQFQLFLDLDASDILDVFQ